MARVSVFQGGNIQQGENTGARYRAADFGDSPMAEGLKSAGAALSKTAEVVDEIQDFHAKAEADSFDLDHLKLSQAIGSDVAQAKGLNAAEGVKAARIRLEKETADLMAKASPRARMILQQRIGARNVGLLDKFDTYEHTEVAKAREANNLALTEQEINDLSSLPDEAEANKGFNERVVPRLMDRAIGVLGLDGAGAKALVAAKRSEFNKGRIVAEAAAGRPVDAMRLADAKLASGEISFADHTDLTRAYRGAALDQRAFLLASGQPDPGGLSLQSAQPQTPADPSLPDPANYYSDEARTPPVAAKANPKAIFGGVILPSEGTEYVIDSNGRGVKMGVNAAWYPGGEAAVKGLTESQAFDYFNKNYFVKSGADKLPAGLAALHVDTFYLNEKAAMRILNQSDGDFNKYMELRLAWMHQITPGMTAKTLARTGKTVDYMRSYNRRNEHIVQFAASAGGDPHFSFSGQVNQNTDMDAVRTEVFANKDMPLDLKMKVIDWAQKIRGDAATEVSLREQQAADRALAITTKLGEGFTNVAQLGDAAIGLSPERLATFTNMAAANVKAKPEPVAVAAAVAYDEIKDPAGFAKPEYLQKLAGMGAKPETIRAVAVRQAQMRANMENPKAVDPVADGSLWTIMKPAFEQRGLLLEGGSQDKKSIQARAERRNQAIGYVRDEQQRWMSAPENHGKKPSDELIRRWTGAALITVGNKRAFEASDHEVYNAMPEAMRREIIHRMYGGKKPNVPIAQVIHDVAEVYRDHKARNP